MKFFIVYYQHNNYPLRDLNGKDYWPYRLIKVVECDEKNLDAELEKASQYQYNNAGCSYQYYVTSGLLTPGNYGQV